MIDFTLSEHQNAVRGMAISFATNVLASASSTYEKHATQKERFQSLRPFYRQAVEGALIKGLIPQPLGGVGGTVLESAILLEEMYKVDRSLSLTIFGTGLGLSPLLVGRTSAQHGEFLKPFLSGEGEPLASLVHSEPTGTANWLVKGGKGLQTTARLDGDEWIINGEKVMSFSYRRILLTSCRCGPRIFLVGTTAAQISNVWFVDILKMEKTKTRPPILQMPF
jgi:alkylation response protein AidB-like acyl-CoA dehydrogenase